VRPDAVFSIDIRATTADGVRLAVEADGPSHFRQPPDSSLMGTTLFRSSGPGCQGVHSGQRASSRSGNMLTIGPSAAGVAITPSIRVRHSGSSIAAILHRLLIRCYRTGPDRTA